MFMLYCFLASLAGAFSAAALGFGILTGSPASVAKAFFVIFMILSVALLGRRPKARTPAKATSSYAEWARGEETVNAPKV